MNLDQITSPTLLLDKTKCLDNINFMVRKAKKHGLLLRPHFKTHQSRIIGNWFRRAGISKIAVSSVKMAEYFAQEDWKDITIAFPANIREIDHINSLAEEIQLNLTIENEESAMFLNKELIYPVDFFIKIDTGYKRTGINFDQFETIDRILNKIKNSKVLNFKGFLCHAGNTYRASNSDEVVEIHTDSLKKLTLLKNHYINNYPDIIISIGDTPSCAIAEDFSGVDEVRPGNFVFFDLMQVTIGACTQDQIAIVMACPIVAKHPVRKEVILHGGAVHFSKECIQMDNQNIYGKMLSLNESGWVSQYDNCYLTKVSQEHGTLQVTEKVFEQIQVGDLVGILPVHSCLTANLMKEYLSIDDEIIDHLS